MDSMTIEYDFLRPLTSGWTGKVEAAQQSRKSGENWLMNARRSSVSPLPAMWDATYTRKVWQGVTPPRFRITINKAFEYVAVYGPNLFWEVPHRTVESKKPLDIPEELFQQDPNAQGSCSS